MPKTTFDEIVNKSVKMNTLCLFIKVNGGGTRN